MVRLDVAFARSLLALLLPCTVPTTALTADFEYTVENGAVTITRYTGAGDAVSIPDMIDGLPVTSIGAEAFFACTRLTSVKIPDSVTSIGGHAFRSCTNLASVTIGKNVASIGDSAFFGCAALQAVTIPESTTSIGEGAFGACTSLTNVVIPKSVTSIGLGPFLYCTSLRGITVDPLNPSYGSLDGVLFDHERTTLIAYPPGKGASYAIPASVLTIGEFAFYHCTIVTGVSVPNTVTNIDAFAFSGCSSLFNITFPSSLTTVGLYAFSDCSTLTEITIPAGVTSMGGGVFAGCTSLMALTVDTDSSCYASVEGVLFNRSQTMLLQFPAGKAGTYMIPAGVTSIGAAAFASCYHLTGVTIPNGVTHIPDWAFDFCSGLTGIVIPDTVTRIGYSAFRACRNLTRITLGYDVTSIESWAFSGCASLTEVYFRGDAPEDESAFPDCPATIYYLPGTAGWGATLSGRPTALWVLPEPVILGFGDSFGVRTNQFGFVISWATNDPPVAVEACADLAQPTWLPVGNVALKNGSAYFSDADWANHPVRLYRVRGQ